MKRAIVGDIGGGKRGIKISKPGKDAETASPQDCILHTETTLLKTKHMAGGSANAYDVSAAALVTMAEIGFTGAPAGTLYRSAKFAAPVASYAYGYIPHAAVFSSAGGSNTAAPVAGCTLEVHVDATKGIMAVMTEQVRSDGYSVSKCLVMAGIAATPFTKPASQAGRFHVFSESVAMSDGTASQVL